MASDAGRPVPPITLCIINYNGAGYLSDALRSAESQAEGFAEILLVDNASTDHSVELVRMQFPRVRVLSLAQNKGPGAARNAGFAAASNDLILFQDNDVRLQPGCVAHLYAVLQERSRALLVAPRVVYERSPDVIQYDSANCHFLGLMALRNANRPLAGTDDTVTRTTSVVTACFLLDRRRWIDTSLFDEDFVFNLEDHDFGVRVNLCGLETWVEPRAVVRHGDGTPGLSYRPYRDTPVQRTFYLIHNRWMIIVKVYALRTLLLLSPILLLYELFQLAGLIRKGWFSHWWRSVTSIARSRSALRRKRSAVQATRRVRDSVLLRPEPLPLTASVRSSRVDRWMVALLEGIANGYWKLVQRFI